jgi:hypothetical protein
MMNRLALIKEADAILKRAGFDIINGAKKHRRRSRTKKPHAGVRPRGGNR